MKKIVWLLALVLYCTPVYAEGTLEIDDQMTADMIYEEALLLESEYPEIIKVNPIGLSTGGKVIFVVLLTESVEQFDHSPEIYVDKMHFAIEGGTHSRENASPTVLLKTIEAYAKDYYDDAFLSGLSVRDYLDEAVFHFIPLSNPDGYDLAKVGLKSVPTPFVNRIKSFYSHDYEQYKSNLNGVDLNRNYPGEYFDTNSMTWIDIWNKVHNGFRSYVPGSAYYFGPESGSEVETQAMMAYLLKYDFRNYLSYHSKGEVVFWYKWMLSDAHNQRSSTLADLISKYTGYAKTYTSKKDSSSGYLTDFTAMQTLKPSLTIETVPAYYSLPSSEPTIRKVLSEVIYVPVIAAIEGKRVGYHKYRLYQDGVYVRDFEEGVYAEAVAKKYGGIILEGEGKPTYYLNALEEPFTRLEMIHRLANYFKTPELHNPVAFEDCDDYFVILARNLGLVSGYNNYFRPTDYVTFEESYVILKKIFYENVVDTSETNPDLKVDYPVLWANESVKTLLINHVVDYDALKVGKITLNEFLGILDKIIGGDDDQLE